MTACIDDDRRACARRATAAPLILVVEDDVRTLDFILTLLKYATNASVLDARDPWSASSAANAAGRPIDLLISDIDLAAGKTGIDLAHELAASHASLKVILMSAREVPRRHLDPAWRFLSKPFMITALLDCVDALGMPVSTRWHGNARR